MHICVVLLFRVIAIHVNLLLTFGVDAIDKFAWGLAALRIRAFRQKCQSLLFIITNVIITHNSSPHPSF